MATQDALNEMQAMFTDAKSAVRERVGLTPVVGEASIPPRGIPDTPNSFLTNEGVADIARNLRKQAAALVQVADELDTLTNSPTQAPSASAFSSVSPKAQRDAEAGDMRAAFTQIINDDTTDGMDIEVEADFDSRYADLSARAQAATYGDAPAPTSGWSCPDHPGVAPVRLVSRKGRSYSACGQSGCMHFER